jgi:predicted phosphodiesterase
MKEADAILVADIHIREDKPICRIDDFLIAQWGKLMEIEELRKKHNCIVLNAGDLFHKAKPSLWLLSKTLVCLPEQFYTVYGNHDLPNHSLNNSEHSGIYALEMAQAIHRLEGTHFGQTPTKPSLTIKGRKILVWHVMTYKDILPYPGCTELTAKKILKKYPEYDLILTGDNHQTFVEKYKGRLLVNPGSMTRQTADQIDHRPVVWLYYADTNTVEPHYLTINAHSVTREHIEKTEERDNRISAFIKGLDTEFGAEISFERNLDVFLKTNRIKGRVKQIIDQSLQDD